MRLYRLGSRSYRAGMALTERCAAVALRPLPAAVDHAGYNTLERQSTAGCDTEFEFALSTLSCARAKLFTNTGQCSAAREPWS